MELGLLGDVQLNIIAYNVPETGQIQWFFQMKRWTVSCMLTQWSAHNMTQKINNKWLVVKYGLIKYKTHAIGALNLYNTFALTWVHCTQLFNDFGKAIIYKGKRYIP